MNSCFFAAFRKKSHSSARLQSGLAFGINIVPCDIKCSFQPSAIFEIDNSGAFKHPWSPLKFEVCYRSLNTSVVKVCDDARLKTERLFDGWL